MKTPPNQPPASLLLVHGAGSGPWIYEGWVNDFPTLYVATVDLHEGLDVSRASMDDYAERVVAMAATAPRPAALCGWSMGGLAVLQAAGRVQPHSVIVLEPSAPAEIAGWDLDVQLTEGTFDPETVYGPFPGEVPGRPESSLARAERKRGISVPSLPCASLVIYGDEFRDERGVAVARLYGASEHHFSGLDHWGLVQDRRVRKAIADFLGIPSAETIGSSGSGCSSGRHQ